MITVRFPNGQAVEYNEAYFLNITHNGWNLYTKDPDKGGKWIASIQFSAGVIIESEPPCRVYNALNNEPDESVLRELKSIKLTLKKLESNK